MASPSQSRPPASQPPSSHQGDVSTMQTAAAVDNLLELVRLLARQSAREAILRRAGCIEWLPLAALIAGALAAALIFEAWRTP